LNVYPVNGKYTLYKRVNKVASGVYVSNYDGKTGYADGKTTTVEYDPDVTVSCGKGIHVSTPFYWDEGNALIQVSVKVDDVITCLEGKMRCKAVKVIGEIKL
jgi:hypothetical protein